MRGANVQQLGMFSYVSMEARVPADHPIRKLLVMVDAILVELDGALASRYSSVGRDRSRRSVCCVLRCCKWCTACAASGCWWSSSTKTCCSASLWGLNIDDSVWDHSTFSFNRERLFDVEVAQRFFEHTVLLARLKELVSDKHFSVGGTLLEAWASHKSFRPKDDDETSDAGDFHGEKCSNEHCIYARALR